MQNVYKGYYTVLFKRDLLLFKLLALQRDKTLNIVLAYNRNSVTVHAEWNLFNILTLHNFNNKKYNQT